MKFGVIYLSMQWMFVNMQLAKKEIVGGGGGGGGWKFF
jgi:hypothetical protein